MGFAIGIGNCISFTRQKASIPSILSSLKSRATYFENVVGTTSILTNLENCKS